MIRRKNPSALSYGRDMDEEGASPMESIANLSDVMLVLAVALMLALITHYSVNLTDSTTVDQSDLEPVETEDWVEGGTTTGEGEAYEEVGTVYRDPQTGDLYMLGD